VLNASVLVPAYNEERNIGRLLKSLSSQKTPCARVTEIIVVASGCTDKTHERVQEAAAGDPRIRVVVQDVRMGKVSAINAYLRERAADSDLTVICGADLLVQPGCLEALLHPFTLDENVGMTGGRPRPTNPPGSVVGTMVKFVWDLHHERSCERPKMGELVAFRSKLVTKLDEKSAVDEAMIEASVEQQGYSLRYVPDAVVANRGPATLREYFEHRRRIEAGHLWLKETTGYEVSTMDWKSALRLSLKHFRLTDPRHDGALLLAMGVEVAAHGLGRLDLRRNYSHAIWKSLETSREVHPTDEQNVIPMDRSADDKGEKSDADAPKGSEAAGLP